VVTQVYHRYDVSGALFTTEIDCEWVTNGNSSMQNINTISNIPPSSPVFDSRDALRGADVFRVRPEAQDLEGFEFVTRDQLAEVRETGRSPTDRRRRAVATDAFGATDGLGQPF
jgi:hypothetical protein